MLRSGLLIVALLDPVSASGTATCDARINVLLGRGEHRLRKSPAGRCGGRRAGPARRVEAQVFAHRGQAESGRLTAELGQRQVVFDVKDGLAGSNERLEQVALRVFGALLVDREVEVRDELRDLVEVVL